MPEIWRKCRTTFRWCRYSVWAVILLGLLAFGWLNVVGLPGFLKTRLTATLRERGVHLEFSRMRLRVVHGLVAENVRAGGENGPGRPALTASEVQLQLNYPALFRGRFQLDGIVVRDGKFILPVSPTNSLVWLNIQTEIRFLPDQTWSLDELRADFFGTRLSLSGQVAHAPEAASWKLFTGRKPGERGELFRPLQDFSDQFARIHFEGQPQLGLTVNGDAHDIHSFTLRAYASVPGMNSPWFSGRGLQLTANLTTPADAMTNANPALDFWTNALPFRLAWNMRAADLRSEKISAHTLECHGLWLAPQLSVTKLSGHLGGGKVFAAASLDVLTRNLAFTNSSDFDPHVFATLLPDRGRRMLGEILWTRPPLIRVGGLVTLPPWTNGMPGWRNGLPAWSDGLASPLALVGELAFTNAVLRGETLNLARTHFSFTNSIWSLPDLELVQNRTKLALGGSASIITKNFRLSLRGALDENSVQPFLKDTPVARALSIVQLTEPVVLAVNAAGNLRTLDTITASGHLSLTNFAVRGQAISSVDTDVTCSNRVLSFLHPQAFRAAGSQTMTAGSVTLDFNARMIYFTNGFSTFEPMVVPRAIGPKTAACIEPYEYLAPPTVRVHGQLPLRDFKSGRDLDGTDLTFDIIRGAPFRWNRLQATNAVGTVHWLGQYLVLSNITAGCYGGRAAGHAYFDFRPVAYGCDFNFGVSVSNLDVHALAADLSTSKTNLLEGSLNGFVEITSANSKSWQSWNGYGSAQLHNGLLWNIPVFGFASPVLNAFSPGLGNSRATEASADFVMTNGVARTDSLTIHTLTMRLQYSGTVDLQQHVNAHVTAQLMRNTWVVGPLVSTVLWPVSKIFECRVTGLVSEPKITPILFPFSKYLLAPLHPIRTFQGIFSTPENPSPPASK